MESSDAQLLASDSDILSSQHGSVRRGLIAVGLDLHSAGDSADGFAATRTSQVSLCGQGRGLWKSLCIVLARSTCDSRVNRPEIGDMDEGVVE